ncbi:uncharacterized protein LOC119611330, partial [Lucilia sericata]|uniref:uncharacterized protein LOC119611330 n=1 Tax=Lucilia sericata TaxID=13632 RepID=UPI0018A86092
KSQMRKDYINFIDLKVNACDVMRPGAGNHMLEMIRREVVKSLNAPFKCPFKENFLYDLKNFSFTDEFFPAFMPFVNFTFGFDYYDSKILIGSARGLGEIAPKTKRHSKVT